MRLLRNINKGRLQYDSQFLKNLFSLLKRNFSHLNSKAEEYIAPKNAEILIQLISFGLIEDQYLRRIKKFLQNVILYTKRHSNFSFH